MTIGSEPSAMNQAMSASWSARCPGGIPARDRQSVPWSPRTARHQAVAMRAMSRRK